MTRRDRTPVRARSGRGDVGASTGPVPVGEVVGAFLEERGIHDQLKRFDVLELWPELVGERIASVTRARGLSEGTLFVEVRSSAWLTELTMMKHQIVERLNEGRDAKTRIDRLVFVQAESWTVNNPERER